MGRASIKSNKGIESGSVNAKSGSDIEFSVAKAHRGGNVLLKGGSGSTMAKAILFESGSGATSSGAVRLESGTGLSSTGSVRLASGATSEAASGNIAVHSEDSMLKIKTALVCVFFPRQVKFHSSQVMVEMCLPGQQPMGPCISRAEGPLGGAFQETSTYEAPTLTLVHPDL